MVDIVTRLGKGSPLTNAEVDANFTNLAEVSGVTGEPMGHEDRTTSTISFNASTRTFTIAPTASSFTVWCKGKKVVVSSAQTVVIPNTTGMHSIYYDANGTLSSKLGYFTFSTEAPTAYVYWNAATGAAPYFGDERHGVVLDWQTHEYLHRTRGAAIANGFLASGYTLNSSATNAATQIAIESGTFFDEDMKIDIVSTATPTAGTYQQNLLFPAKIPVLHLQGTSWVMDAPTDFPFKQGTSRPQYNSLSGGVWSTADVGNNQHATTWILATNNLTYPVIAIIGQSATDNLGEAEAFSFADLTLTGFPSVEFRPLYKLIYKASDGYANSVNAQLVSIVDLRSISAVGSVANPATDHGNLSGLSDDDHPQYLSVDTVRGSLTAAVKASFLPSQTSNDGKFLQTDGTATSWQALTSGNVTTALGFTPYNATNPSGYITGISSSDVTTALGFTPYNATNPSGYVTAAGARGAISVTGAGSYDSATGVINIVGGVTSFNTRTGAITLSSSDVTTALGFTPYNSTNPNGYLTGITSTQVTTALGYTPYNSSNPSGYITGITSGMVTTALGFTPYNNSNPSGYITSAALSPYLTTASAASTYLALSGGTMTGIINMAGTQKITTAGYAGIEYYNTAGNWEGYIGTENNTGNLRYNARLGTHTWYANSTSIGAWDASSLRVSGSVLTTTGASSWGVYSNTNGSNYSGIWFSTNVGELLLRKADGSLSTRIAADGSYAFINNNNILHAGNYTSFSLPVTGGTFTGNVTLDTGNGEIVVSPTGWRSSDRAAIKIRSKANAPAEIDLRHTVSGVESGWHISARDTSSASELHFYRFNMNSAGAADSAGSFLQMFTFRADGSFNTAGAITQSGSQVLTAGNYSSYALPISGGTLTGTLYFTDTTNGLYKSGGRLNVRSESTDNVAEYASYGLYLPKSGQAAGLYVESPIEARGGLRLGNSAGSGTITVGADTAATANRLVQRDSNGHITGNYILGSYFNSSAGNSENPTIGQVWTQSTGDNYLRKSTPAHFISQLGLLTTSNYSSYALPLSGGTMSGAIRTPTNTGIFIGSGVTTSDALRINWHTDGDLNYYIGKRAGVWTQPMDISFYTGLRYHTHQAYGGHRFYTTGIDSNMSFSVGDGDNNVRVTNTLFIGGNTALHAGNYNSYAPTLTGGNASGTWGISISGNAATATSADAIDGVGFRNTGSNSGTNADTIESNGITYYTAGVPNFTGNSTDGALYSQAYSSSWQHQIAGDYRSGQIALRGKNANTWQSWRTVLDSSNYSSYALPLSGGILSGAIRAPQITAGGSTYTDANFGVQGSSHLTGTIYYGGTVGNVNSWSSISTSSSGTHTFSGSRFIFDRYGYGSQPLIDLQNGSITLSQPTTVSSVINATGPAIRQGNDLARPLASWGSSGATGMVIFKLPGSSGNYGMVHMVFDIYEYNSNSVSTVIVGGHNWASTWYNTGANVVGQLAKQVRLGYKDGQYCVVFGDASSYWEYGQIVFRKIQNGAYYTGIMDLGSTVSVQFTATESFTNIGGDLRALRTPASFNAGGAITQAGNQVLHAANYTSYSPSLGGSGASGTWGINITGRGYPRRSDGGDLNFYWSGQSGQPPWLWGGSDGANMYVYNPSNFNVNSASYAGYLPTFYAGGQQTNPQVYFGQSIGLRVAMTGAPSVWSDTLWINGYSGGDVPNMCALHTIRNGTPRMWISTQAHTSTSYGTYYEFLTTWNYSSYALPLSGGTTTGIVNITGNGNTGSNNNVGLNVYSTGGNGANMAFHRAGVYAVNMGLDSDNVFRIGGWSASANLFQMDMSGNLTMANNVTAYSDERLKKDWAALPSDFVERLAKIKAGTYTRLDREERQAGVSAQDFQKLLPETVLADNEGTLSLAYGNAALVSAVELAKDNVELRARIERLESLINKLIGD